MAEVSEHGWEELFVKESTGMYLYAGLDQCSRCGALRRMVESSTIYKPGHWGYNTLEEPPCVEDKP